MAEQGPLSGQKVEDKYLLGELLGEGGFGAVYKAQHIHLQRQQAIKILLEHHFHKSEFRARFLREAQTVAALDHLYIIHLDDFWVEPSRAYLVMPFMSEGTLQDILRKQQGFLKLERIVSYLEQICAALDYAHNRGVVHLDLKPLNLLVHEDGRLLLSDFGLAHLMKQGAIEGGSSLRFGTPHYMAPEHIQGHPERRSDLFSLGVILYQMLVGQRPFEGLTPEAVMIKNITELPRSPREFRPELPQAVDEMLGKALAKQPEQRYQTANEFLVAFKNMLKPLQKPIPSSPVLEQPTISQQGKLIIGSFQDSPKRSNRRPYQYLWPAPSPEQSVEQLEKYPQHQPVPAKQEQPMAKGYISMIRVEEGKEAGRIYEIRKDPFSIGRSREVDIFLEDLALSRLHASIINMGNSNYVLRDEGSANGTKVNGQTVSKYQPFPLKDGDRIQLGQTILVFQQSASQLCPYCGTQVGAELKYCTNCGRQMQLF